MGKWRVCAVAKLILTTWYHSVTMNEKGSMERKRVLKEEFIPTKALFGMKHNMYAVRSNNYYLLYNISRYIRILLCTRYLLALSLYYYELLVVLCWIKHPMNNIQYSANPNPNLHFLNDRVFHFSNFSPSSQFFNHY